MGGNCPPYDSFSKTATALPKHALTKINDLKETFFDVANCIQMHFNKILETVNRKHNKISKSIDFNFIHKWNVTTKARKGWQ